MSDTQTPQQQQQGCPAIKQQGDTHTNNDHTPSRPMLAVDNTWREQEQNIAQTVATAQTPILFIAEKSAETYGKMAKYVGDTFPNTPVVFESEKAQKDFRGNAGSHRRHFEDLTMGIASHAGNGKMAAPFQASDCIVVLGSPRDRMRRDLQSMQADTRSVYISETLSNPDAKPSARVNFAAVQAETKEPRNRAWRDRAMAMRPRLTVLGG